MPGPRADRDAAGAHDVSGLRVLVADDNEDFADSIAILLRGQSNEVEVTHDGESALARAVELRPDIAFIDIGLPGRIGYDLARALRAHPATSDAVLVAVTGWGQERDRQLAREAGFDNHLVKPVEPGAVAAMLRTVRSR